MIYPGFSLRLALGVCDEIFHPQCWFNSSEHILCAQGTDQPGPTTEQSLTLPQFQLKFCPHAGVYTTTIGYFMWAWSIYMKLPRISRHFQLDSWVAVNHFTLVDPSHSERSECWSHNVYSFFFCPQVPLNKHRCLWRMPIHWRTGSVRQWPDFSAFWSATAFNPSKDTPD